MQRMILVCLFMQWMLIGTTNAGEVGNDFTVDIDVLIKTGDPSPDGNGVFSNEIPLPPVLNNNGEVLFWARLLATEDPDTIDDFGFFRADRQSISNIARGGEVSATGNTLRLDFQAITDPTATLRNYAIADNGLVTYATLDSVGVFAIYQSNGVETNVLLQDGQDTSFGDNLDFGVGVQSLQFNDQGQVAFLAFADTPLGNSSPLYARTDQSNEVLIYTLQQPLPDGREVFGLPSVQAGVGFNNLGEVAANLRTSNFSVVDAGIYAGDSLTTVLHTGEPSVDGLGTFSNTVGFPFTPLVEFNDQNQTLVLQSVDDVFIDYQGLFFHDGTQLVEWARTGDDTFGGVLAGFRVDFDLNDNGSGAYQITNGSSTSDQIILRQSNGLETLVVSSFSQLPPPIDLQVNAPFTLLLNNNNQVMFTASVNVDGFSRLALFLYDLDNGLALVARVGQEFRGDILAGLSIGTPFFPFTNRYRNNASNPFNDQGEMAFGYTLTNGESGIALASVEFVDESFLFADGFED